MHRVMTELQRQQTARLNRPERLQLPQDVHPGYVWAGCVLLAGVVAFLAWAIP